MYWYVLVWLVGIGVNWLVWIGMDGIKLAVNTEIKFQSCLVSKPSVLETWQILFTYIPVEYHNLLFFGLPLYQFQRSYLALVFLLLRIEMNHKILWEFHFSGFSIGTMVDFGLTGFDIYGIYMPSEIQGCVNRFTAICSSLETIIGIFLKVKLNVIGFYAIAIVAIKNDWSKVFEKETKTLPLIHFEV